MTRFTHCIVHAGTHKTGTTTVQDVLAAHRVDLAAAGFFYPAIDHKGRDHNLLAHRLATCTDEDLKSMGDELMGAPARYGLPLSDAVTLLLSAEELSTRICDADAWAGFDDWSYWDRRRHFLARLRSVLPEASPIEVFICFRDHESYAHSLYATKVLSGKIEWSFGDFVRRCAPIFNYRRQVEVLAESLGPVRVESYERLRGDLANRFFSWLGLPVQVEQTPRLRPTPTLDLVYWLSRAVRSPLGGEERKQRAAFCRAYKSVAVNERVVVDSLWQSAQERSDFLSQCHVPPLDAWPQAPVNGRIAEPEALDRRADEIEAEYRQWLRSGGQRKHWAHFWRRR